MGINLFTYDTVPYGGFEDSKFLGIPGNCGTSGNGGKPGISGFSDYSTKKIIEIETNEMPSWEEYIRKKNNNL